ncbi:MAG: D-glycero-beta-D-manno-heptose-7-phosphate kinase [Candidatus Zixiibacteriota bacterium]
MYLNHNRLKEIFDNIKDTKILVIGDIMLDRYVWGDCERISPEAPVPVIHVKGETERAGGAANVAINIAKLGGKPSILGLIGKDMHGRTLNNILEENSISRDYLVEIENRPTTVKTRVIAQNQQVVRVDREDMQDIDGKLHDEMVKELRKALPHIDGIIISDYGKGVITRDFLDIILLEARRDNTYISVDPKERHFEIYHEISLITPNTKETSYAVGYKVESDESVKSAGHELLRKLKADSVLITRGSKGMSLFTHDKEYHLPTLAQKVFDVTGAGDTVIAAVTTACCSGCGIYEAAIIANHAAGISVSELGTKAVSPDEIERSMEIERKKDS